MEYTQEQWQNILNNAKKAAEDGDVEAMKAMASFLRFGRSMNENNLSAALPYYKQAADAGDAESAEMVGACYGGLLESMENGALAFKYMKQAADKGIAKAQRYIGYYYSEGYGCEKDFTLAKQYFEKAALQNDGMAQWELFNLLMKEAKAVNETSAIKIAGDASEWAFLAYVNGIQEAEEFIKASNMWGTPACNTMIENAKRKKAAMCGEQYTPPVKTQSASATKTTGNTKSGGCYIATAVYGSYGCPQVWTLRRFRDNILASTWYGRVLIKAYYAISPTIVKWFGKTAVFQNFWRKRLDKLVKRLRDNGVKDTPYGDKEF